MLKKILCIVMVIMMVFIFILMPLSSNYNCYAIVEALSLETYQMIAPFLLIAGGLIYTDVEKFYNDSLALAEYIYQSAIEEWGEWKGQVVTKGQMAKIFILENYRKSPDEPPPDPKKPKYYIPIHISILEMAKAFIINVLQLGPGENVVPLDPNVYPVMNLDGQIMLLETLDEETWSSGPIVHFFDINGNYMPEYYLKATERQYTNYWTGTDFTVNQVVGPFDSGPNPIEISYWENTHISFSYMYNPNDWEYWIDENNITNPNEDYAWRGPYYKSGKYANHWFPINDVAFYYIGQNYHFKTYEWLVDWLGQEDADRYVEKYGLAEYPYISVVEVEGIPGIVDDEEYLISNYGDDFYIPIEQELDDLGEPVFNPDGIPSDEKAISDIIEITISDLENLDMQESLEGEPGDFPGTGENPDPDPGGNPYPFPEPLPDPEPIPEPYPEPDPDIEPDGVVGEWVLSIPILGDIVRILIQIRDFVYNIFLSIYSLLEYIIDKLKHMLISLFVPEPDVLIDSFTPLVETFENKFNYDISFLYSMQEVPQRKPENIEITIMGATGIIVNFDDLHETLMIIRPWIQSFIYFMLALYHINQVYKLIRGTSLIELKMAENQIHNRE